MNNKLPRLSNLVKPLQDVLKKEDESKPAATETKEEIKPANYSQQTHTASK